MAANLGLVGVRTLMWYPPFIYQSFQLWRIITPFLFMGGLGFAMLINLVFLLRYSQQLEQGRFGGRLADYVFMLGFGAILLLVAATIIGAPFMADGLIMFLVYVWARTNPNVDMSFMFGIRFKSAYFPWVLIGFKFLMGGSPYMDVAGALIGHIYIYLKDIYPQVPGGKRFLETPQFLLNLLPPGAGINQFGVAQQPHIQMPQAHPWGAGHRLGGH